MDRDESLMAHTEKVVSDMLKYVLTPNEMQIEENVEIVLIDETEENSANHFPLNTSTAEAEAAGSRDVLKEIEMFLAQELQKIRAEFPMYAAAGNAYLCQNCAANALQPAAGGYGINNWFNGNAVESIYPNNQCQRAQICANELWNGDEEWPVVGDCPRRVKPIASGQNSAADAEDNSEENTEEELERNHNEITMLPAIEPPQPIQEQTQSENGEAANISQGSSATQTAALQHTHSTTTTTTAFGMVHQQTSSSTTTNFVSNHLANAALAATTPAAIYAQAVLAQQWAAILKDAQQRYVQQQLQQAHSPAMHGNSNQQPYNLNGSIYERFAYAQWLQQQILHQQQQATIAALLQQQKIALQNNIAAAAVAAQAANSNLLAQAASVIGSTCGNFAANFSITSSTTATPANAINMNIQMNSSSFAVAAKNDADSNCFTSNQQNRSTHACTPTNSTVSIDSLNLGASAASEQRNNARCPFIATDQQISQGSHD